MIAIIIIGALIIFIAKDTRQFILIGVDGMQYDHFTTMLSTGKLPNYQRLIDNGGIATSAQIAGHIETSTAPGNAEIFTGLPSSITTITDNSCGKSIPEGLTVFERLYGGDSSIALGLIYGKNTCYVPQSLLAHAKPIIPWWFDMNNFSPKSYISPSYADSKDISLKALEFLNLNKKNSFFLTIYYGVPDAAGHTYGENSTQYDEALINTDQALGILLDWMKENDSKISMIITSDHGWNEGTTEHSQNTTNTRTIPLLSNDPSIISSPSTKYQCSIVPTLYKYFKIKSSIYTDITNTGCFSMY